MNIQVGNCQIFSEDGMIIYIYVYKNKNSRLYQRTITTNRELKLLDTKAT